MQPPAPLHRGLPPQRSAIALACTLALLAAAGTATAQTLDSVVVSASRAEQSSFDAPAALESVSRDVIESAGPQVNLSESLNRVPGLTILNRQNYAQDLQLSIRGFSSRATFGIRGIRLLIDGIPATTPDGQAQGSSIALTSTDRIEVLRGPLAQLYGNAAGGVIQAWTRDAPDTPEANLQLHAGSFDMRRTVWQLGGKVGEVGVVADYSTFDTDGFRDNSKTQRRQFNSKLTFGPSEQTRVTVVANVFDMPLAQDPLGLTAARLAIDPSEAGANAESRRVRKITSQTQLGTSITHALDAQRSLTTRAYTGRRDNLQYQVTGATGAWVGLDRDYYGVGLQYNAQSTMGDTPVQWVAGYDYDHSTERRQGGTAIAGEKSTTTRDEDNSARNSDVFFQGTALLSDRWSLTGGMRHSTVRFNSEDFAGNGAGSGSVKYSATNPVLGLTWHASDSMNIYANIGKGFETPTLAELSYKDDGASGVVQTFNTSIAAARSRHFELGSKWTPTPQSRLDLAAYHIKTTDEIVVSRSDGASSFKNAPGTTRTGLELSARSLLGSNWRATLSATAIQAEFSETFTTNNVTVQTGNRLPGIPQHFVFGELLWAQQGYAGAAPKAGPGLQAGVELIDAGKMQVNDVNNDTNIPGQTQATGYTVLNLKASQAWRVGKGSLTAYARVDNVTDRAYVGSVIVNQTFQRFYEPAPGRNWTVGLRLNVPL